MYFLRNKVIKIARLKFAAAYTAAYLFEAAAVLIYFNIVTVPYALYMMVGAHLMAAFSFILFTTSKLGVLSGVGHYYPRIAALFTLFMPVLGLLGISVTLLLSRVFMSSHGLAEEYKEKAYEGVEIDINMPEDVTEFLYDEVDVHPIADILSGDDMGMKRGAVNLLRRIGSAEAVKLLRKSLSDENAEVRFYAHTALTRLEEDYADSLEKSRFNVDRYDSAQSHADFAAINRNYARSGLPEVNMQEQSMAESCEHWKIACNLDPENVDFKMRLAEVYSESKRFSDGLEIYQTVIDFPEYELEARLGIFRIFFEMGDFAALFKEVEKMQSKAVPEMSDPFKRKVYEFWADFDLERKGTEDLLNYGEASL